MNFTLVMGNNFQSTPRRVYSIVISMNKMHVRDSFCRRQIKGQ